jgi:hypothetical protein
VSSADLIWIETLGGPWILLPNRHLKNWGGGLRSSLLVGPKSDYENLCEAMTDESGTSTYVAATGNQREVLGVGEMAQKITILNLKARGQCIVEWFGADSDIQLAERLSTAEDGDLLNEVVFHAIDRNYSLFDSVWPGEDAPHRASISFIPGKYKATSRIIKTNDGEFGVTTFMVLN